MTVAVVTDSAAALPDEVVDALDIGVVPIVVTVGDHTLTDGELSDQELLAQTDVSSAAPSPGDFGAAIARCGDADGVVVITMASTLSATHRAATIGARTVRHPTVVVDSGTAAGAQALVVHAAASVARTGGTIDEVAARARWVAERVRLVGALSNLHQLTRSGRVPELAGRAGDALGLRPMFDIHDSRVRRLRPARSDRAAERRIVERCLTSRPTHPARLHVVAVHAGAPERAGRLLDAVVAGGVDLATCFTSRFGQAIVANSGLGVCGLAWLWEQEYRYCRED